jgi:hypothetical protein
MVKVTRGKLKIREWFLAPLTTQEGEKKQVTLAL